MVLTSALGEHLAAPMHKPLKPFYIRPLVRLIEAAL